MNRRQKRAEEARRTILESGDRELINRLHLMEASQARSGRGGRGPGLLGTAAAVGGGAYLGTLLAGMTLNAEMQRAFAAVAEDMGVSPGDLGLSPAAMEGDVGADDGGLFDDFGGFFDL
ncbi:hypothetical protein [Halorhodospira halophila]|uniref:Uncharacterized protein n=1 Tax=Halorhodospira halophila (strain DSM 244 / SL1) TaxID=349124 RepID=A1WVY3_HALHL|nr:hypothetical protein [Halorhodospira halophila]ABM61845.1 hypothetical protein Hhal_1069 [Halorhodospira halophila SL1]MBK1728827.1 hypothetical protein [Halorhodospira halophila]